MSTRHNCPHPDRGRSNYRLRLSRRGYTKAPVMERLETLRVRQLRRFNETGSPVWSGRESTEEGTAA